MRIKRGISVRKKHNKIRAQVKGYLKSRQSSIKRAKEAINKAGRYAYRDRRVKKRTFRASWISKINAALKPHDIKYSIFIKKLKDNKIELDRKVLADLAQNNPEVFDQVVKEVK